MSLPSTPEASGSSGRWAAGVEYVGSAYSGWQSQEGVASIQAELEFAISSIADRAVSVTAAGRTDAGVHAYQQVIHFDPLAERDAHAWLLGVNTKLPRDISLRWVQPVRADFHARFSAVARSYRYVIHNSRARAALAGGRAWWVVSPLDEAAMHRAAQALLGENDFSAFRDSQCQSPTPMRNLHRIAVSRRGEFVFLDVTANAFLHHMVRNIVGTLLPVGQGKQPEAWVAQVLAGRKRTEAGMTAESGGLYFVGPQYPAEFALPAPVAPWF